MQREYQLLPLGDRAIIVDFGNIIDEEINSRVIELFNWWETESPSEKEEHFSYVKDLIPAYSSLTIVYDAAIIRKEHHASLAFKFMKEKVEHSMENVGTKKSGPARLVKIPVCYDLSLAPDLVEMAELKRISMEEIVYRHHTKKYRVYMIGFLPGFAYMGKVDEQIAMPRKINPRVLVPSGSVGIAGIQTGIYPLDSPGGWNIIGQTPAKLFDANDDDPVLLRADDKVEFTPVSLEQFNELKLIQ
ncbi:MAG: 5-oxoprolinase subunit PxpB [Chitinophagales bacterium]